MSNEHDVALPDLLRPINAASTGFGQLWRPLFNEDQMRAYARAAIAQRRAKEAQAVQWPKSRDVTRLGDMSPPGDTRLRVLFDSDNDVIVEVIQQDLTREPKEFALAAVEFCNGGGGGGQSARTRMALIALMCAIEADNASAPNKAWPQRATPHTKDATA